MGICLSRLTHRKEILLHHTLGDPDLCPNHIYFQWNASQQGFASFRMWEFFKRQRVTAKNEGFLFLVCFWDSVSNSSSAAPLSEQTPPALVKPEDQKTHMFSVFMCVCVGDKSPDPISCLLPIPIYIFDLWQLASKSQVSHLQMTLWVRGSIFCHSPKCSTREPFGARQSKSRAEIENKPVRSVSICT